MSCWNVLGLPPDADSRTIKRHYAALLKKTRPDDDPVGFQRLREAYEAALDWNQSPQPIDVQTVLVDVRPVLVDPLEQTIAQRHHDAQTDGSALHFEIQLLYRCINGDLSPEDRRWAFDTFSWLTAWQRLELPGELVERLERQQRTALQQPLRDALEREDEAGFLAAYAARTEYHWVNNHPHADWFNQWLARLLAQSRYWSNAVFEAVCAGQGWHGGTGHACPPGDWATLLQQQQRPAFIAHQRELATQASDSPQQRAARLLLAPMTLGQRRTLAQRFDEHDWKACQALSADIYADHVTIAEAMPGGTVYFWQGWDQSVDTWPWIVALILSCLVGVLVNAEHLAGNVIPTLAHGILWSLGFVIGAGLAWQGWRPLAHHYRVLDEHLSQRLPRWLSPTHLPLLPIRDLAPGLTLVAILGYGVGPFAGLTLIAVLTLIGVIKRPFMNSHTPWTLRHPRWTALGITLCILTVITLSFGLRVLDGQYRVVRNQGLQQWTERLCSRMPRSDIECQAPATQAQWYGQEAAQ